MSSGVSGNFKQRLQDNEDRVDYESKNFKIFFFLFIFLSIVFMSMFTDFGENGLSGYFFRIAYFHTENYGFYLFMTSLWLFFYMWVKGIPTFLSKQLEKRGFFKKYPKLSWIKKGKLKFLEEFFYPKVTFSDNIPRSSNLSFFNSKEKNISPSTLFDFGTYSKEGGTDDIILLFRDKQREALLKRIRETGSKEKLLKKNKKQLEYYDNKYKNKGIPSPEQELLYQDLFMMLQGTYESYGSKGDNKIHDAFIPTPLKITTTREKTTRKIISRKVFIDTNIDVIHNGKVHFSIEMLQDTISKLTDLYIVFLQNRSGKGRFLKFSSDDFKKFEIYFKFFMMRRFLKNYSNIPSGWICTKMEDYTMRAIASNIDREMIVTINSNNNGKNPNYDSDIPTHKFLFSYWAFMNEEEICGHIEELDFIFNATKEAHEIEARNITREESRKLMSIINDTYDQLGDSALEIIENIDIGENSREKEFLRLKEEGKIEVPYAPQIREVKRDEEIEKQLQKQNIQKNESVVMS